MRFAEVDEDVGSAVAPVAPSSAPSATPPSTGRPVAAAPVAHVPTESVLASASASVCDKFWESDGLRSNSSSERIASFSERAVDWLKLPLSMVVEPAGQRSGSRRTATARRFYEPILLRSRSTLEAEPAVLPSTGSSVSASTVAAEAGGRKVDDACVCASVRVRVLELMSMCDFIRSIAAGRRAERGREREREGERDGDAQRQRQRQRQRKNRLGAGWVAS